MLAPQACLSCMEFCESATTATTASTGGRTGAHNNHNNNHNNHNNDNNHHNFYERSKTLILLHWEHRGFGRFFVHMQQHRHVEGNKWAVDTHWSGNTVLIPVLIVKPLMGLSDGTSIRIRIPFRG